MRQIIPFTKDITFKTKIGDITGISLDNDLVLKGEDLISGNFYVTGTYKMIKTSSLEEEYSYKIPCEIAISDDYDCFDASIDIDNFTYEIVNDSILRVKIDLVIDNLEVKEKEEVREDLSFSNVYVSDMENDNLQQEKDEDFKEVEKFDVIKEEKKELAVSDRDNKIDKLFSSEDVSLNIDEYKTYSIYIVREGDTIEKIANNYKISVNDIESYNDINNITVGVKLVIPSV